MTDIRLKQKFFDYERTADYTITIDWVLNPDGTLDTDDELATAAIVALGTDRLAGVGDILPDPSSTDRRGWWGDLDAALVWPGAWPIGTRLWLLSREKIVGAAARQGATTVRVDHYIREAMQPFLDLHIGSRLLIAVEKTPTERIYALVRLYRGPILAIDLRYEILWEGIRKR